MKNFINFSLRFKVNQFKKKLVYTEPLDYKKVKVTPALNVPQGIQRPSYVNRILYQIINPNFKVNQGNDEPYIHTQEEISRLKESCKITAKTLEIAVSSVRVKKLSYRKE